MNKMRPLKNILQILVIVLLAVFLYKFYVQHTAEIQNIFQHCQIWPLIKSLFFIALGSIVTASAWAYLVKSLCHNHLSYRKLIAVWHFSQAGIYIPGSVWSLVGRAYFLIKLNVSKSFAIFSMAVEQLNTHAAAFLVACFTPQIFESLHLPGWLASILAPLGFLILFPAVINNFLIKLRIKKLEGLVSFKPPQFVLIVNFLGYIVSYILIGIAIFYIMLSFGISHKGLDPITLASFSAASYLIGSVTLFAPNGLGVREGVLIFLLSKYLNLPEAIFISFSLRFWSIIISLLGVLISYVYLKTSDQRILRNL
jgi:uncharacterized membrane protein YbhN (UPF0104 family)